MFKKEYLAKMLVIFGIATLITWTVNFISLLIPFQFKVTKWVFLFSQEISEKSIFPLLGILAIIGGVYLCNSAKECKDSKCRCAVWAERLSAAFCAFFFAGLIAVVVVYSLSIKPLQTDVKTQIQGEADKVKAQITMMAQSNPQIKQENLQMGLQDLNIRVTVELKKAKTDIIINSIKILTDLVLSAFVYLMFAIYLLKMSLLKNKCTNINTEN